jgi:type VI secretion system secreted protein VgrG
MEQEGIYYYFKHEIDKHTLVLADSVGSHEAFAGYEKLPYFPPDEQALRERDHIYDWNISQEVQPGVYALTDFDFTRPKANLEVKASIKREHARSSMEIYDYPGEYLQTGDGETYVRSRIEELQAEHEQVQGQGNARGLSVGRLFELTDYLREDQNREYLIVSATHQVESDAYSSGSGSGAGEVYSCSFTAMPSKQPFHRYSKSDENSSCWVRVAQVWAGTKWGGIQIPRIGQEVIIEFLEGDPDHPMITGRVYNNDNMPPYDLPANATQSGIKSRSSKGGSADNFNQLRFEDKKGAEEINLHGEKDWTITIKNDKNQSVGNNETLSVGNNRDKSVGNDQSETIGVNKTIQVGTNHTETIGAEMSQTVGANMSQTVGSNKTETISIAKNLSIGAAYQVSVGAAMNETVGAAKAEEIGAVKSVNVGASSSENVGANKSVDAGGNISESASKDVSISSGKKMSLSAGDDFSVAGKKNGVIDIKDQLTIKVGKATITMKKNGDIAINGKTINIKGSGNIVMKGKKILEN